MPQRLAVTKTYKLFINGGFPRSESGRSLIVRSPAGETLAHVSHGSRKDLRDAVEAARQAQPGWAARTAYNRGQILYRMAEMLEGKREEFIASIRATTGDRAAAARREVDASIDRLVAFAGWADKYAQVLGCNNPVAGPHYNFTVPQPTGVVAIIPPDEPALLGLIALMAPPLCAGNALVVVAHEAHPLPACILGEVLATSDLPPGVINLITTRRVELLEHIAQHRNIHAVSAANLPADQATTLRLGAAENVKRVRIETVDDAAAWLDPAQREHPWTIEPFVEMKTIWHPAAT